MSLVKANLLSRKGGKKRQKSRQNDIPDPDFDSADNVLLYPLWPRRCARTHPPDTPARTHHALTHMPTCARAHALNACTPHAPTHAGSPHPRVCTHAPAHPRNTHTTRTHTVRTHTHIHTPVHPHTHECMHTHTHSPTRACTHVQCPLWRMALGDCVVTRKVPNAGSL